ncbi:MAG: AI-2E family transporter [Planctomycetota bacterium]|nr:AI-2E family transporter [Planctomycetota bacterium]
MEPETNQPEQQYKTLPPPWDRIFSLGMRLFVWALIATGIYILRPFFLLIFLTFVFAYIQAHGVQGLQNRIRNRPLRVTIVALVFLGTILATAFTLAPQIEDQGLKLYNRYPDLIAKADLSINQKLREYPEIWSYLEKREQDAAEVHSATQAKPTPASEPHLLKDGIQSLLGFGEQATSNPDAMKIRTKETISKLFESVSSVLGYLSSFLLSLLFSFLIVLDLAKLKQTITTLGQTKVGFIYREVGDNIATFGRVLGRALEAQLFIALINTIMTSIGCWVLGIGSIPVLAAIVFLCSFIPVAGVFVSSTPICLLALQDSTGGISAMLMAIVMILIVHAIETYILNPRIYGHHMHMNPVMVLIVLTISGKLIGVWGLVLGIPLVNYFFRHAIRYPKDRPNDAAA